jgi:hypothetical protein
MKYLLVAASLFPIVLPVQPDAPGKPSNRGTSRYASATTAPSTFLDWLRPFSAWCMFHRRKSFLKTGDVGLSWLVPFMIEFPKHHTISAGTDTSFFLVFCCLDDTALDWGRHRQEAGTWARKKRRL